MKLSYSGIFVALLGCSGQPSGGATLQPSFAPSPPKPSHEDAVNADTPKPKDPPPDPGARFVMDLRALLADGYTLVDHSADSWRLEGAEAVVPLSFTFAKNDTFKRLTLVPTPSKNGQSVGLETDIITARLLATHEVVEGPFAKTQNCGEVDWAAQLARLEDGKGLAIGQTLADSHEPFDPPAWGRPGNFLSMPAPLCYRAETFHASAAQSELYAILAAEVSTSYATHSSAHRGLANIVEAPELPNTGNKQWYVCVGTKDPIACHRLVTSKNGTIISLEKRHTDFIRDHIEYEYHKKQKELSAFLTKHNRDKRIVALRGKGVGNNQGVALTHPSGATMFLQHNQFCEIVFDMTSDYKDSCDSEKRMQPSSSPKPRL